MESLQTARNENVVFDFLNPIERKRKSGVPVGLKNIGNTYKYLKNFHNLLKINLFWISINFKKNKKKAVILILCCRLIL